MVIEMKTTNRTEISQREKEVIEMIAKGYTDSEIAEKFNISYNTIRSIIGTIFLKLQIDNRPQLVYIALKEGLIK